MRVVIAPSNIKKNIIYKYGSLVIVFLTKFS